MFLFAMVMFVVAVAAALVWFLTPQHVLSLERRRPGETEPDSFVSKVALQATSQLDKVVSKRGALLPGKLDAAGMKTPAHDFAFLVICGAVALFAAGLLFGGALVASMLVLVGVAGTWLGLGFVAGRRQKKFGLQLDETTHLLSGSLRAGYTFQQAMAAAASESDSPSQEEFTRVNNEIRLGRGVGDALESAAVRMKSDDLKWLAQAVAINTEVGGNLADVIDNVGETIRMRAELKRKVATLASEGKMSAYILGGLPIAMAGVVSLASPGYLDPLFTTPIGWVLLGIAAVMFLIGGLWMRSMIQIKY